MYYYGWGLDPTYILVLIGAAFALIAQMHVKSTFKKYSKIRSGTGMTGAETAQRILSYSGISGVMVSHVGGELTDHFSPKDGVVNLSDTVYGESSVAAVAVAAHECGHVQQHDNNYLPLSIRTAIVPVANIGSYAAWPLIVAGLLIPTNVAGDLGYYLIQLGIWAFGAAVAFQVITLPVEFNASRRALITLQDMGILSAEELPMAKKVLNAAALTYVASAAAALLQLLRLLMIAGRRK